MQETQKMWVWSLDQEDPLGEEKAPHSSVLDWKIAWAEECSGLHPWGAKSGTQLSSHRVQHNEMNVNVSLPISVPAASSHHRLLPLKELNSWEPILRYKMYPWETSLVVQWLRLCTLNAGSPGLTPGQESINNPTGHSWTSCMLHQSSPVLQLRPGAAREVFFKNYTARCNCKDMHHNFIIFPFWVNYFHFLFYTYVCIF